MDYKYIIKQILPEEYKALKREAPTIVRTAKEILNENDRPKIQDIIISFKYNPQRYTIGIFIKKGEQEQLVLDEQGLSEEENALTNSLRMTLEERLDRIRIPQENWE